MGGLSALLSAYSGEMFRQSKIQTVLAERDTSKAVFTWGERGLGAEKGDGLVARDSGQGGIRGLYLKVVVCTPETGAGHPANRLNTTGSISPRCEVVKSMISCYTVNAFGGSGPAKCTAQEEGAFAMTV